MNRCVSCDAALVGRYCANCGEKVLEGADLDWRHYLFKELPHAIFEVDGALPRTLISLFTRPGELAKAFVSGRRRSFIPPVRLYVLAFLVYELTGSLMGHGRPTLSMVERVNLVDPTGILEKLLNLRDPGFWKDSATEARLSERAKWLSESGTFVIAIFVAMLQSFVFIKFRRRYLEHLSLALNVTTFILLCTAFGKLFVIIFYKGNHSDVEAWLQTLLALIALPIYWFFSTKRFYEIKPIWALLSAAAMTFGVAVIALFLNIISLAILIITA